MLNPAFSQLYAVENDKVTDDLTKWRQFCYAQIVRIQDIKYKTKMHSSYRNQMIDPLKAKYDELLGVLKTKDYELSEITNKLKSTRENKEKLSEKLDNATTKKFDIQRKKKFYDQFPEQFRLKMNNANQFLEFDIKDIFTRSHKELDKVQAKIDRLISRVNSYTQFDTTIEIPETRKYEEKKAALEEYATELAISFNQLQFPECKVEILPLLQNYQDVRLVEKDLDTAIRENDKIEQAIQSASLESYEINIQTLQTQISQEAQRQKLELETLKSQYDLSDLQTEIDQCNLTNSDLEHKIDEERKNMSILLKQKQEVLEKANEEAAKNDEIIQQLTKEYNSLAPLIPKHSHDTKDEQVNTIYNGPWFNF